MSEPLPPVETVESAMRHASEQLRALKKAKPQNAAEARLHSAELVRLQQELISATHRATDAAAAKRLNGGNGAAPADRENRPLTTGDFRMLAHAIVPFVRDVLAEAEAPLNARLGSLEASQLTDGGVWKPEKEFRPNQLATYRGAIWICLRANTDERPGKSDGAWRLMHKTEDGGR